MVPAEYRTAEVVEEFNAANFLGENFSSLLELANSSNRRDSFLNSINHFHLVRLTDSVALLSSNLKQRDQMLQREHDELKTRLKKN